MELQKYLENTKNFEEAKKKIHELWEGLCIKESKEFPTLYVIFVKNSHYEEIFNINLSILFECNGIILEKNTNRIVYYGFNMMNHQFNYDDINIDSNNKISNNYLHNYGLSWNDSEIFEYKDGFKIKVYWYENKWIVSTPKCINAGKSYWNSKLSFRELFLDCIKQKHIDFRFKKLSKKYCYLFLVQTPKYNGIFENNNYRLFLLLSRKINDIDDNNDNMIIDNKHNIGVPRLKDVKNNFKNFNDLINTVNNSVDDTTSFIIRTKDTNNFNFIKIETKKYMNLCKLNGNLNFYFLNMKRKVIEHFYYLIKNDRLDEYYESFAFNKRNMKIIENNFDRMIKHFYFIFKKIKSPTRIDFKIIDLNKYGGKDLCSDKFKLKYYYNFFNYLNFKTRKQRYVKWIDFKNIIINSRDEDLIRIHCLYYELP